MRGGEKLGTKFYIGLSSPEERKALFLHYFGGSAQSTPAPTPDEFYRGPLHRREPAMEDPYDPATWYTRRQLQRMRNGPSTSLDVAALFSSRYAVVERKTGDEGTSTNPELYDIRELSDYFRYLLYGRDDLFMKVVPLYEYRKRHGKKPRAEYKEDWELQEIYNEIVAGYFLSELVYGYSEVLSLNFMTIVDWFPAPKKDVVPGNDRAQLLYHQIVVSERIDQPLVDYLMDNPSIDVLRAVLFQIFHALEIAWHTHGYIHQDLHTGNLMLQRIGPDSPLFEKDFLYRRLSSPYWYRVGRDGLRNNLLKIIDFGRNRLLVPSQPDHVNAKGDRRHLHDRIVNVESYSVSYGRNDDVESVLQGIGNGMTDSYWEHMGDDGMRSFFAMRKRLGRETRDKVATDVLDDSFFEPYRTKAILPAWPLTDEEVLNERDRHVVVSFPVDPLEADLLETREMSLGYASPLFERAISKCCVCHTTRRAMTHKVGDSKVFCGLSCYEFAYLFHGRTVYR